MSIQAKLHIDDQEIKIIRFRYDFDQPTDVNGRPLGKPILRGLWAVVETQKALSLEEWAMASNQKKQLAIHLTPTLLGGKTRIINFIDTHLVRWEVNYSGTGTAPMTETLYITAAGLKDGAATTEYTAYWRETFPNNAPITTRNNNEEEEQEEETGFLVDLELSL